MLKRLTLMAALAALPFLMFATRAGAQASEWTKVFQLTPPDNSYISASWFFNPEVGIIGFHWNNINNNSGMVMRTVDGGKTFTPCTVPPLNNTAPIVEDIWFSDQDSGWLVVAGSLNINDPRLWRTVDGGQTWTGNPQQFTGPASVRQTPSALTVTEPLGIGIWTSTDEGVTWTTHSTRKNGLDFVSPLHGVATEYKLGDVNSTFLSTADGGLSWAEVPLGIQHEAFGVYAIKNSRTFVVAPEDTMIGGVTQPSPVLRSVDNGLHWNQPLSLPMQTTGGIQGVDGVIYVQNSGATIAGAPSGLLRSIDSGKTWTRAYGPSQGDGSAYPITDTRFSVTGCGNIVYASDGDGGLWKTIDGGDSISLIPQCHFVDTDAHRADSSIICDTGRHFYYLHNTNYLNNDTTNPGAIIIQSLNIFDTTRRPDTTHAVFFDSVPLPYTPIKPGDSVAFGLAWHPGAMMDSTASDSVTIRVIYQITYYKPTWGLDPYDTIYVTVKLFGLSTPADFSLSAKNITKDTIPICSSVDSTLLLINKGCDSLAITSALLEKNNWTLVDAAGNPLSLPIHLAPYRTPGDTVRLRLKATPTSAAILSDSLEVQMRYMAHDTSFGIGLHTAVKFNPKQPALTIIPDTLNFDSLAICDSTESPLTLKNNGCDTISITKADLTDPHFELLDMNGNPLTLPIIIASDSTRQILIRFIPGTIATFTAPVRFHFHRYIYSTFDSSNIATLTGIGASAGTLTIPAQPVDFGAIPICDSIGYESITFRNSSCDSALVSSLVVSAPFFLDSGKVPIMIGPGQPITFKIRYIPTQKGVQGGTAAIDCFLNNHATEKTGTVPLTGAGTNGISTFVTNPPLLPTTLAFDTLNPCDQPYSITFGVFNTGCDTLQVTGISLDPSLTVAFTSSEDKSLPVFLAPDSIGNGDTLHVTVAISALIPGSYNGNLHLQFKTADGTAGDTLVPVSLTITPGGGPSVLSTAPHDTLDFQSFHSCDTPDTSITLQYTGCGTISVNDSIAGNGFVISSHTGLRLSNGNTYTVHLTYDGASTGPLASTLFIHSTAATNADDTIHLFGKVVPADTVHFSVSVSKSPIVEGDIFNVMLTPDVKFTGTGLNSVQGVIEWPRDHFATSAAHVDVGDIEEYSFMVKGSNIQLVPGTPLVTLPMEAMIADTVGGTISVNSLALNGGDTNFSNCTLSTSAPLAATTNFQTQCGDSILIGVLNGRPIVTAEKPRPNPVTSETEYQTTVNLLAAEDGVVEVILYDALGEQLTRDNVTVAGGGTVPYTFNLGVLPAGSYYYALRFIGQTATSGTLHGTFLLLK